MQGRKIKFSGATADDYTNVSAVTQATVKRGRPVGSKNKPKTAGEKKAKVNACTVIKQMKSTAKKTKSGKTPQKVIKDDNLFHI